jgi:hypothetical protein
MRFDFSPDLPLPLKRVRFFECVKVESGRTFLSDTYFIILLNSLNIDNF